MDPIFFDHFDPDRVSYPIGLDPYGLCKREDIRLSSPLPDVLLDAEKSVDVPPIIHCIWMGQPMPSIRPDYWKHVTDLNQKYREQGFHLVMWCNGSAIDSAFQAMCKKEEIILLNIFDVFQPGELKLESAILYCLSSIPPNFGEASDLLRYNLLYRFGGVYLDEDTAGQIVQEDAAREKSIIAEHRDVATQYFAKITTNNPQANDYFVSCPRHPFFRKVLDAAELVYQFPFNEWRIKGLHQKEASQMLLPRFRTLFRTGPGVTSKIWASSAYPSHPLFKTVAEYSWKCAPPKEIPLDCASRVVTTILFQLKETPSTLVLFPFEGLGQENLWKVVSFIFEFFPKECASIQQCHTNFPDLFDKIGQRIPNLTDDPADRLLY